MGSKTWTRDGSIILDKEHYSTSMSNLCMTETYSDLTLISEEGTRFPAHRSFLAARSDYFSALLYGGLKESTENVVTLMWSDGVLKSILLFLYSGKIDLKSSSVDFLMNLLDVARLMCIDNLKEALEDFLQWVTPYSIKHLINILNVATEKEFQNLISYARHRLEVRIDEVLKSKDHLQSFSALSLKTFLSGNDLDVPEIEIFHGIVDWMSTQTITSQDKSAVLSAVRLEQMSTKQLVRDVYPSGLFSESDVNSAIHSQEDTVPKENTRKVILNQNLCLSSLGAKVIKAVKSEQSEVDVVINGQAFANDYDHKKGYAMSKIGDGFEVRLSSSQKINKIMILLHDKDALLGQEHNSVREVQKNYSYRIETSLYGLKWDEVADFSNYKCRSWQTIYFQDRRVKYIKLVGTRLEQAHTTKRAYALSSNIRIDESLGNGLTPTNHIHVVSIEAMLDTNTEEKDRKNSGMKKFVEP